MRVLLCMLLVGCGARSGLDGEPPDGGERCVPRGAEVCNGEDDDCDGRVDEAIDPVSCGPELCPTIVSCEGGVLPTCVPRPLSEEVCNLEDDDCDGSVDEGLAFGPLGEVQVLRFDEFDTGDCTSCRWAAGTTIAPVGDGFMAVWKLGLSGGAERANLYGRRLDGRGHPVGPIELLRDDFVLNMHPIAALEPLPAFGVPVEAFYRVGRSDIFGALFVGPSGETRTVLPLAPSGARNTELMVWSGERLIGVWAGLQIVSYAEDGTDERLIDVGLVPERVAATTLGVYPGRVGVLAAVIREDDVREQWLVVLDSAGEVVSARRTEIPYQPWNRLIGIPDGWLYIRPNASRGPSSWQLLSVEGDALTELRPFDDGRTFSDSGGEDIFVPLPEQRQTLAVWHSPWGRPDTDLHVEYLDARGEVTRSWSGPLPVEPDPDHAYFGHPHLARVDDRIIVVWNAGAPNSAPNSVYSLELGCTP